MIRISLPDIYKLAETLDWLSLVAPHTSIEDNMYTLTSAHLAIDQLLNKSVFASTLRSCRSAGESLLATLDDFIVEEPTEEFTARQSAALDHLFEQFKTALLAEIGVLPSYFVTQKAGFDTLMLLERGQSMFPQDLHEKVPEAVFDIQQAAKALAYELPTACGFHAFRATESVLRSYYSHVSGGSPPPKVRNIGVYISAMRRAAVGDEIILASLEQLTKLHRNPLVHPEVVLTLDEAISTLGMARSVVSAMLKTLPALAPTTSHP